MAFMKFLQKLAQEEGLQAAFCAGLVILDNHGSPWMLTTDLEISLSATGQDADKISARSV